MLNKSASSQILSYAKTRKQTEESYSEKLERLYALKSELLTDEVQEYLKCVEHIESLEKEKKQSMRRIDASCSHNIYHVKEIDGTGLYSRVILECVLCDKLIALSNYTILTWPQLNYTIIGGIDEEEKKIIPTKEYLGEESKNIIREKYLEICSKVVELNKSFIENDMTEYLDLIKTPEQIVSEYYEELFNTIDKYKAKTFIHCKPTFINNSAKSKYL